MTQKQFYAWLVLASALGVIWFALNSGSSLGLGITVCPIKAVTGVPCPSCGSTRALGALFSGHFAQSFLINPLAYLMAAFFVFIPFLLLIDLFTRKAWLWKFYLRFEKKFQSPYIYVPAILLVALNWIWNIIKGN